MLGTLGEATTGYTNTSSMSISDDDRNGSRRRFKNPSLPSSNVSSCCDGVDEAGFLPVLLSVDCCR